MSINLVSDTDEVYSVGSPPGSKGYTLRDSTASNEEGRMNQVGDEPGAPLWLVAREFIAANGETPEVEGEAWAADLAAAKARRKAEVNREALYLLSKYDWYRLREADGGSAMPAPVLTYRSDVRTEANASETAIDALGTVDACRDFVPSWPAAV
jgi:hypothetical protein